MVDLADLLLLETPLGKLDPMREQITSRKRMSQSEFTPQCSQTILGLAISSPSSLRRDFHDKVVIRITTKPALVNFIPPDNMLEMLTQGSRIPRLHFGNRHH